LKKDIKKFGQFINEDTSSILDKLSNKKYLEEIAFERYLKGADWMDKKTHELEHNCQGFIDGVNWLIGELKKDIK